MEDPRTGTHEYVHDERNSDVLVLVNGELTPRAEAVVSVFDSGFVLGDGVWEGLRVHHGHPAFLEQHLDRLFEGAAAIVLDIGRTRDELTRDIYRTLEANDMRDGVHIRLMATRGERKKKMREGRRSQGLSGACNASPKELRDAWSIREPQCPTIADYVADPMSDAKPDHGYQT